MPIYEYVCQACGHELEAIQKVSDEPLVTCPVCNKIELKKKISAAGFRLKGSGWYETDFKNKSTKKGDVKETKSSAKTAAKASCGGGGCGSHKH